MESSTKTPKPRGGKREGSGRPVGFKFEKTLTKEKVAEAVRQQICNIADKLVRAQTVVAFGYHKLITPHKDSKTGEVEWKIVNDGKTMDDLLENGVFGKDYLFTVGAEPDHKAIANMLDRAIGKPVETLDVGNKNNQPFILKMDT